MSVLRAASIAVIFSASLISGCASTPDPAKVCTAEWIKPRTERAMGNITKRTQNAMKPLRKAAKSYANGKEPGIFQMMALGSAFTKLERELKSGRGIKDLKTVATTCNDPSLVSNAMMGYMQSQGLPGGVINFIQGLPQYQDLISLDNFRR